MAHVRRFDHIGITVADLASVTAFFVGLGLEVEGTGWFLAVSSGFGDQLMIKWCGPGVAG
jgi:catechol 2,3-dioxygenase-like lactoylglutathione lyase family enzyme